jgi:hypothetical protein
MQSALLIRRKPSAYRVDQSSQRRKRISLECRWSLHQHHQERGKDVEMVEVKWSDNRSPAQRIQDRLKQGTDNYPLKPNAQVTTNPMRTITTIHFGASQAPSDRGFGEHDPVAALARATAELKGK